MVAHFENNIQLPHKQRQVLEGSYVPSLVIVTPSPLPAETPFTPAMEPNVSDEPWMQMENTSSP